MTPAFWIWIALFTAAGAAAAAARRLLARARARLSGALRPRRRAWVVAITDEYLHEYTGLTREDLERTFREPKRRGPLVDLDRSADGRAKHA